jgi:hypothetical protein
MQVLEEEDEEDREALLRIQEEDSDEEDSKGKTKFNFSGMSFAEYISSIKEGLNNEMRDIVNTFVK